MYPFISVSIIILYSSMVIINLLLLCLLTSFLLFISFIRRRSCHHKMMLSSWPAVSSVLLLLLALYARTFNSLLLCYLSINAEKRQTSTCFIRVLLLCYARVGVLGTRLPVHWLSVLAKFIYMTSLYCTFILCTMLGFSASPALYLSLIITSIANVCIVPIVQWLSANTGDLMEQGSP